MKKNVNIVTEYDGNKVVIISDIRFKGKTREEWEEVEEYLKEYIGTCYIRQFYRDQMQKLRPMPHKQ